MDDYQMVERIAALEVEVKHLNRTVDSMDTKLTEMHNLLQQARGIRWFAIGLWVAFGSAMTYFAKFFSVGLK